MTFHALMLLFRYIEAGRTALCMQSNVVRCLSH